MVSGNGPVATVPSVAACWYVDNSAFRLCQLTQSWEPTPRPHPVDTTPFGVLGTDLGIPIEHKGRLYLFFGDCLPAPHNAADGDPIAFTTVSDSDDLETTAPDMHWILGGDGQFRRLILDGVNLGNFEVPTGGFSYDGQLYVFAGSRKHTNPDRMTASFLGVGDDPHNNFQLLQNITSTVGDEPFPGGRWMLHISPTVVRGSDLPGLQSPPGDVLLMFGSSIYRGIPDGDLWPQERDASNVYLAWAPLTSGAVYPVSPIPPADEWMFLTGFSGPASTQPVWQQLRAGAIPMPVLPADGPGASRLLGEISAFYASDLGRWFLSGSVQGPVNVARFPWGPWTVSETIVDPTVPTKDAGNLVPGQEWTRKKITYAPYLVRRWTKWDRSTRTVRLYYTLSVFDQPEQVQYQPQLMRSSMQCRPKTS
jgi:hypothetical protein